MRPSICGTPCVGTPPEEALEATTALLEATTPLLGTCRTRCRAGDSPRRRPCDGPLVVDDGPLMEVGDLSLGRSPAGVDPSSA